MGGEGSWGGREEESAKGNGTGTARNARLGEAREEMVMLLLFRCCAVQPLLKLPSLSLSLPHSLPPRPILLVPPVRILRTSFSRASSPCARAARRDKAYSP
jgi:hypothetical protein